MSRVGPRIPLADLARQHEPLRAELDAALGRVLDRGDFVRGQEVGRFEQAFADYLGVAHAVGVGSGTDALYLALAGAGIGPGDEVITAANSFAATAEAIVLTGATPVFADVDDETLCLDPGSAEQALTERSRAMIPVHLHGHLAPMDALGELARAHGLHVVEDAAQAHGAHLAGADGAMAGTLGAAGAFSFFPSKNLGCCGDGGLLATNDGELAEQVEMLHDHGRSNGRHHAVAGLCSRLDTVQAAILLVKLPLLDGWNANRRAMARLYDELLQGCPGLRLPPHCEGAVFHHYAVRTPRRDELREHLAAEGVATGLHYPLPIPREPAFARFRTVPTPVSDRSCREVLSLPLFPEMRSDEVRAVAAAVRSLLDG